MMAPLFGYSPRTGQRWASETDDRLDVPDAVNWLAHCMVAAKLSSPAELLEWVERKG
jgi:hypothetical protein